MTVPRLLPALGPAGMRSDWLMTLALRWMGNLVTDEDRDRAARVWRWAGRRSLARDHRPPFIVSRPALEGWYRTAIGTARVATAALDLTTRVEGLENLPRTGPVILAVEPQRLSRLPLDRGGCPQARPVRAVHVPPRRLEQVGGAPTR